MPKSAYFPLLVLLALILFINPFSSTPCAAANMRPYPGPSQLGSSVAGRVSDTNGKAIERVRIQLYDASTNTLIRTVLTDGTGGFYLRGLGSGTYIVEVLTTGTNYLQPHSERISIEPTRQGNGEIIQVNFTLKTMDEISAGGFNQTVPEAARQSYNNAVKFLDTDKNEEQGVAALKQALEQFPTYFMALQRLGTIYVTNKQYEEAIPLLTKAIEVNSKADQSLYLLGRAQLGLKRNSDAIETFRRGLRVAPKSANLNLGLGMALYADGKIDEAEAAFKQAYKQGGKSIPIVHMYLAQLYDKQKRYKDEATELELYVKEQPDDPNAAKYKQIIENLHKKTQ